MRQVRRRFFWTSKYQRAVLLTSLRHPSPRLRHVLESSFLITPDGRQWLYLLRKVIFLITFRRASLQQMQYTESRRYCQLHFSGSNPTVTFARLGEVQVIVESSQSIRFEGRTENSLCIVFQSDVVLFWNFVTAEYATWTLPSSNLYDNVSHLVSVAEASISHGIP